MLIDYLTQRTGKRRSATKPLIDDNSQAILIAGRTRLPPELLRGHVGNGSNRLLGLLGTRALGNDSNVKFGEQDLMGTAEQHVLRFDIAMDQFLLMDVVQSLSHLLDIRN